MKEQMIHWQDGNLILTPNRCYIKLTRRIIVTGVLFLALGLYLEIRFADFWQLPLAIGLCLTVLPLLYLLMVVSQTITIPKGPGPIVFQVGKLYRKEIWNKQETELVRNSINGRLFLAISNKNNPYGKAYQISPFLTNKQKEIFFEQEILPIVHLQLEAEK